MVETKAWKAGDLLIPERQLAKGSCLVGPRTLSGEDFEVMTGDTMGKERIVAYNLP